MAMLGSRVFTTKGKANCNRRLKTPVEKVHYDTMRDFYMISMFCLLKRSFVTIIFSYQGKNLILLQITLKEESAGPRPANKVLLEHSQT